MRLGHKLFHLCPLVAGSVFFSLKVFGGNSEEVTPVPIPNTEVKLFSADGTAWETAWESRTPPNKFKSPSFLRGAFCFVHLDGSFLQFLAGRNFSMSPKNLVILYREASLLKKIMTRPLSY